MLSVAPLPTVVTLKGLACGNSLSILLRFMLRLGNPMTGSLSLMMRRLSPLLLNSHVLRRCCGCGRRSLGLDWLEIRLVFWLTIVLYLYLAPVNDTAVTLYLFVVVCAVICPQLGTLCSKERNPGSVLLFSGQCRRRGGCHC
jgi:hypothetical protein